MSYDQWMAALCIWREARGASLQAMTGIWHVLQNRVNDSRDRWPKNIPEVVCQRKQFSSFNLGDPNSLIFPLRSHAADWVAWQNCQVAVNVPLNGDPTHGATNYHSLPEGSELPAWAAKEWLTVEIGPFKFYKL